MRLGHYHPNLRHSTSVSRAISIAVAFTSICHPHFPSAPSRHAQHGQQRATLLDWRRCPRQGEDGAGKLPSCAVRSRLANAVIQIRARRLAKLGTSTPAAPKPEETKASEADSSTPSRPPIPRTQSDAAADSSRPKINITPAAAGSSSNPFTKLGVKEGSSKLEPEGSTGSPRPSRKRLASEIDDGVSAERPPQRNTSSQLESDEDYANRILSHIFHITVNPHVMTDGQSHRLAFLPSLNEELNESNEPLKLSVGNLDQALMEALNAWPLEKPLMQYLLPCWKRALKSATQAKTTRGPRHEVHEEAKRLTMSSCLFALTMPDLYGCVCC